jgi:hypothetical protein
MGTLAQTANTLRVALIIGATDKRNVIDWADTQIEASATPCMELIDISLGSSKTDTELAALLKSLARDTRDLSSIKAAMGLLADSIRAKQLDVQNGILNCYRFCKSEDLLFVDDFMIFHNLEVDLSLIQDGIFGPEKWLELENDLLNALDEMGIDGKNQG